jgi:hypothetical protein
MYRSTSRLPLCGALLLAFGLSSGCASTSPATATKKTAPDQIVTVKAGPHGHRFDMQQNGRSMTAEEFDTWMKARGIRVAKGAPAKPKTTASAARRAR